MIERFIVYYLGDPKKDEEGWAFVEKTRKFDTLKQALKKSKELMKKNRKIIQTSIEKIMPPKIIEDNEAVVVLWNDKYVNEEGEDGIVTEFQSDKYKSKAKK